MRLTVKGNVTRLVTVTPSRVRLAGPAGKDLFQSVDIVPEQNFPFTVTGFETSKKGNVSVEMTPVEKNGKTVYRLTVHNLKKDKAQYRDTVRVKTTLDRKPVITIPIFGIIKKAP